MKKRPLKRSYLSSRLSAETSQNWIVFLLALLVIITAVDLYLDHFGAEGPPEMGRSELPAEKAVEETRPAETDVETESYAPQATEEPSTPSQPVTLPSPSEIKVQVLNGCGVRGIASKFRGILRQRGFDVMSYGNAAKQDYRKSQVIIRREGAFAEGAAVVVAESLGIPSGQVLTEFDPTLVDIDITLLLGQDYNQLSQ